ncbi:MULTISPECIES: ComEC/Rec2 family competence protein [unclassified Rhizobium]|uniref:ComEC/Rec2 family competence protein n=1 Tax=unclassified Rhizobium TaxID=2613769 RepID=UPI000CDF56A4|nr:MULTISPECIES: ComEC/Rec2 family competence protein [Rhizobium]AVA21478.1 ComEC/Rec2-related protein [Rhizobium sp. NXC24]UWU22576.1 ComEC family competence protein [Rhizobium tropici]
MPNLEAPDPQVDSRELAAVAVREQGVGAVISRAKASRPERTQDHAALIARLRLAAGSIRLGIYHLAEEEAAHGRAMLFAPVYIGAGAIVWFSVGADPPPQAVFTALLIFAVAFFRQQQAGRVLQHILFAGMLVCSGMALAQCETWRASTVMLDSAVTTTITGRIERREADDKGRWRYVVALEATEKPTIRRPPAQITIFVRKQLQPFELGDRIQGRARLTPPAGPALPGLNDFAFSAYFDGTGANGFAYGTPTLLSPTGDVVQGSVLDKADIWLAGLRSHIGDRIRTLLPGDTGAFAASLVTDERRAISDDTTEALRTSGLAHIIAISGLNMALSAGIFYVGLRYALSLFFGVAQAWPTKKIAAFGALVTVTAYYLISGFGVSAERAFIMMAIMLIAVLFDRPSISLRNVALSAIVILILSPSQALGPSFQMSYAATLALVSGYSLWARRPHRESVLSRFRVMRPLLFVSRFFGSILSTSFIGGASTAIFSIEHFHRLATYGLVANLAAMPVVSFVVMPFGMAATLLMPFGVDAPFWQITGWGLDVVIVIAKTVAAWGGNIPFGRLPVWLFPTVIAGFLLMTLLRTWLRHAGALLITGSVAVVALGPGVLKPDLMISEDGTLVALLRNGALTTNREKPPDFIFEQWQRALAITEQQPPTMLPPDSQLPKISKSDKHRRLNSEEQSAVRKAMDAALDAAGPGGFACQKGAWCVAMLDNGDMLVTIEDAAYLAPACDTANIVITSVRLRLDRCRSGATLFTGATLRRTGSIEMSLSTDKPIMTAAFENLSRPWSLHRSYDWRTDTFGAPLKPASPVSDSGE